MFDTIQKLGWKVDVRRHVIKEVIMKVLEAEDIEWEKGRKVPIPREEENCVVSALLFDLRLYCDKRREGLFQVGVWKL